MPRIVTLFKTSYKMKALKCITLGMILHCISAKMNKWGCRDWMHHAKKFSWKQGNPLLSKILAQSCVTPLPELCREELHMIVLVSLIEGDFLISAIFLKVHSIPTPPFCTYFLWFVYQRNYAHAYMHRLARAAL